MPTLAGGWYHTVVNFFFPPADRQFVDVYHDGEFLGRCSRGLRNAVQSTRPRNQTQVKTTMALGRDFFSSGSYQFLNYTKVRIDELYIFNNALDIYGPNLNS